jgi:hypothetical protein
MMIIKFCKDKTYCHGYTTSESLRRQWHESDVILGCFIGSSRSLFLSSDNCERFTKKSFFWLSPQCFYHSVWVYRYSTAQRHMMDQGTYPTEIQGAYWQDSGSMIDTKKALHSPFHQHSGLQPSDAFGRPPRGLKIYQAILIHSIGKCAWKTGERKNLGVKES